jgi:hypothetical protein
MKQSILYTIEARKPVSRGGRLASVANFSRLVSAISELNKLANKLTSGEIGSIVFICHEPPSFRQCIYFADEVPMLIAALKEARQ